MTGERVRFGAWEFDPQSGELRRLDAAGAVEVRRLPRQPALLLALLAERTGDVVSREEIRERIWPGVSVDFETSLHFCIRQVRSALDDSAAQPRYVETLPRRGYRFLPQVESTVTTGEAQPRVPRTRRRWRVWAGLLAGVALLLLLLSTRGPFEGEAPIRIAILPFGPPATWSGPRDVASIAESILEELDRLAGGRAAIVGPTTTSGYSDGPAALAELVSSYRIEFIVNGRFLEDRTGVRMLAELIRAQDGAHVWVRSYENLADARGIGIEIGRGVARHLALAEDVREPPNGAVGDAR